MIVVDTNVIAYLFIEGEHTQQAKKLYLYDSDWITPYLWRSEFRNVLTLYMRKNIIKLEQAQRIMNSAVNLLRGREYDVPSYEVLRLASTSKCSAYDCEFVAAANDLEAPLVTVDKQLLHEFSSVAVSLVSFSE